MLTVQLASRYGTVWVPEYAREYLDRIGRPYEEDDILRIAQGQMRNEESMHHRASNFLFCDTELLVTKIWSEVKYGRCHPWILQAMEIHRYDLFLLCDIDLPWEPDPLREHPHRRQFLFDLYFNELTAKGWPFAVVSGIGEERTKDAISIINTFFPGSM